MRRTLLFLLPAFFLLLSCTKEREQELRISTNAWIGYAPLFYAHKRGYLDSLNIKLITNVSLAEASAIYEIGKAQLVTTTQYEYHSLKENGHAIVPIILLDRSNGGDTILSNRSLTQLHKAKKIYAYLEIDSINTELLKDFMHHTKLDQKRFVFINKDQAQIEDLKLREDRAMVIVTYIPYSLALKKRGFKEIASTKDMNTLIVIDALCADKKTVAREKDRLRRLKKIIDKSILEIEADTHKSYTLVKSYIGNIHYQEYLDSLTQIKWINTPSKELLERIEPMGYKGTDLIQ